MVPKSGMVVQMLKHSVSPKFLCLQNSVSPKFIGSKDGMVVPLLPYTIVANIHSIKTLRVSKMSVSSKFCVFKSGMVVPEFYQSCIRVVVPSLWDATLGRGLG